MNKAKPVTLYKQLSRQILPKVVVALFVFCFVLTVFYVYIAQYQLNQQHKTYTESFNEVFTSNLSNYVTLVNNLAQNDLILNGLFDQRTREEFLPLFFQGLQLNNEENISAALFDFEGQIILSRDWEVVPPKLDKVLWNQQVLADLVPFVHIDSNGVFVIAPILFEDMAEGAFAVYSKSISSFFSPKRDQAYQLIFNIEGSLLYSNYTDLPRDLSTFDDIDSYFNSHYTVIDTFGNYRVMSVESYRYAYGYSLWIVPILLFAMIMAIGLSFFSSRLAANIAGRTLTQLHDELNNQADGVHLARKIEHEEASEIQEIRASFTSLKEKTLSLSLKNERINNVIDSFREFLVVIDDKGRTILTNKNASYFFKESELTIESIQRQLLQAKEEGNNSIQLASGQRTSIWRTFPMLDGSGYVIAGEDITRQLELEEALNIRTKAIEVATSAFVISDINLTDQPIVYANQAFFDLTGYSQEEVIGSNCRFLQGKNTTKESIQKIRDAIAGGKNLSVNIVNYRKDGTEFINELVLTPVPNEKGQVTHYIGSQQDITKREKAAQYLADAKNQAEEFARIQQRFFANMNHELRTPINGIKGMLKALQKSSLDQKQERFVEIAERSSENLLVIVNDILEFSKAESDGIELDETDFDLTNLLEDIKENYAVQCGEKNLQFLYKTNKKETMWVKADALRLQQILQNLLNNALKFTLAGSVHLNVKVTEDQENGYILTCRVADTGIGLSEQQQEKIFDAFAQASSSTSRNFGGTGLGLSICRQLTKLMGGEIYVQSEEHKGSVFSFFVNLKAGAENIQGDTESSNEKTIDPANPPVVLIAEDNEINQVVLLENLEGVKPIIAPNGIKALEILKNAKVRFDVILMDNEMPEMDGVTATKLIRSGEAGEHYREVPIIAVTAHAMESDRKRFLNAGMSDYISKPINPTLLNSKIVSWTTSRRIQVKSGAASA